MSKKPMKLGPEPQEVVSTAFVHDETRWRELLKAVGGLLAASRITGVSDEQIGKWRDGRSKAPFLAAAALCQAANISLEWLATGEGPMMRYGDSRPLPFDPGVAQMAAEAVDFMDIGMRKRKRKPWSTEERQAMLDQVYRWFMNQAEG